MHCLTARGHWAAQLLQCTASRPKDSGHCNFCNAVPHCLGAVGSATPAMHCSAASGQWALELMQCTSTPPGGSASAATHCLRPGGAVGRSSATMHFDTAWGQWAMELWQHTATLPWGSGRWNTCNVLPHCVPRMQYGLALHKLHYPLPPGIVAVHCRSSVAHCPQALRECIAGVSLPAVPGKCGSAWEELHWPAVSAMTL